MRLVQVCDPTCKEQCRGKDHRIGTEDPGFVAKGDSQVVRNGSSHQERRGNTRRVDELARHSQSGAAVSHRWTYHGETETEEQDVLPSRRQPDEGVGQFIMGDDPAFGFLVLFESAEGAFSGGVGTRSRGLGGREVGEGARWVESSVV